MSVRIVEGDALTVLRTLADQSVQMCVTSPPYFGLRDYGVSGQLGLEKTPQLYVDAMVGVFSEVRRVLRDDGTLWLNIGDSYAGSGKGGNPDPGSSKQATNRGSQSVGCLYGETGKTAREAEVTNVTRKTFDGIKAKDLIGIPWLLAFGLRADGWYLRSEIIWHKLNPMPESVLDRPTKSHEQIFLLSKSPTYFFDADAIAEDSVSTDDARFGGPRIAYDRKTGPTAAPTFQGQRSAVTIRATRNRRSVWAVNTSGYSEAHFATFPPKLIEPCILAGSSEKGCCPQCGKCWARIVERGEPNKVTTRGQKDWAAETGQRDNVGGLPTRSTSTLGWRPACKCRLPNTIDAVPYTPKHCTVLDPFGGAGTTGLVADRLGRDALLIELNPKYAEMARRRIHSDNPLFGDVA